MKSCLATPVENLDSAYNGGSQSSLDQVRNHGVFEWTHASRFDSHMLMEPMVVDAYDIGRLRHKPSGLTSKRMQEDISDDAENQRRRAETKKV